MVEASSLSYNPVIVAQWRGLDGLIECLSEQMLARGTGALSMADGSRIYLVFGHPLHAVDGDAFGVQAIEAIADLAASQPDLQIAWIPRLTAGKSHSLVPADGVVERLRTRVTSQGSSTQTSMPEDNQHMADLGLRRLISRQDTVTAAQTDPGWADVVSSIAAMFDAALHRHAAVLVESLGRAQPESRSILMAIERSRSVPVRMVSPERVSALLDAAEALVREKMAGG